MGCKEKCMVVRNKMFAYDILNLQLGQVETIFRGAQNTYYKFDFFKVFIILTTPYPINTTPTSKFNILIKAIGTLCFRSENNITDNPIKRKVADPTEKPKIYNSFFV